MFTRGEAEEARLAILREGKELELADRLGDAGYRAILWDGLYAFTCGEAAYGKGGRLRTDSVAFGLSRRNPEPDFVDALCPCTFCREPRRGDALR